MMFKWFLVLEWKAFLRAASFGKSIGLKLLLFFLALYFSALFLILGVGLYPFLQDFFPETDPLTLVNSFMLIWLVLEFSFRFMLQTLPVLHIKPLMALPVPKRKAVNFVLLKSLFSFPNLLPFLIIIPFGIFTAVQGAHLLPGILSWMLAAGCLSISVNFLNFIVKKRFIDNFSTLFPIILAGGILALLEFFGLNNGRLWFGNFLDHLVLHPWFVLIPVLLVFLLFRWNQRNLENRFYLDAGISGKAGNFHTGDFFWTRKLGSLAPFLQLDLKLILRNKRPRTAVYLSFFLLFYGLIFYPNPVYQEDPAFFVFVGIFITGIFMINFGQFIPSWDAAYYPLIMSQDISLRDYLASKAVLIGSSVVVLTILVTPYAYFGWDILLINLVCGLYNIGVNIPVLLYAGSFNKKKIDLDTSPLMNYQGFGAAQWLAGIPLMALPILIFWLMEGLLGMEAGIILLGGLGLSGILLGKSLLAWLALLYQKRKYSMINGFNQTGE